jgi:hypothetical protein
VNFFSDRGNQLNSFTVSGVATASSGGTVSPSAGTFCFSFERLDTEHLKLISGWALRADPHLTLNLLRRCSRLRGSNMC